MRPVLLLLAALWLPWRPALAADLAAHRASYKLVLGTSNSSDVVAAEGRMEYEVTDACDAWAVRQRLDMTLTNQDGQDIKMVSDYATLESKDGLRLRFHMRQMTDTAVTGQVDGEASLERTGGPGVVHYTTPAETTRTLPAGTFFPMMHTAAIVAAAEAGKKFLAVPLFDGTGADGAQDTFVTVASWGKGAPAAYPALTLLPSGRVHVAFFDRGKTASVPDYDVGMRYWSNGVADDLAMNFGDFVMRGTLTEFRLEPGRC